MPKKKPGAKEKLFKLYCEPRWNSTYEMCQRYLELMDVVEFALRDDNNAFDCAPPENVAPIIELYTQALKPFYDLTKLAQGAVSALLPYFK